MPKSCVFESRTWNSTSSTAAIVFRPRATSSWTGGWRVSCDKIGAYVIWVNPPAGGASGAGPLFDRGRGDAARPSGDGSACGAQAHGAVERGGDEGIPGVVAGRPAGGIQCARGREGRPVPYLCAHRVG